MNDATRRAVVAVLQEARDNGFVQMEFRGSVNTGLGRWRRLVNTLARWLGADTPPFTDPWNCRRLSRRSLRAVADPALIDAALVELADPPRCRRCGGANLDADPAGYYEDAQDWRGAPLLCLDCNR